MKAEIGFVDDNSERMKLVIEATSPTEWSALAVFAKRAGFRTDHACGGCTLTIEEPAAVRK